MNVPVLNSLDTDSQPSVRWVLSEQSFATQEVRSPILDRTPSVEIQTALTDFTPGTRLQTLLSLAWTCFGVTSCGFQHLGQTSRVNITALLPREQTFLSGSLCLFKGRHHSPLPPPPQVSNLKTFKIMTVPPYSLSLKELISFCSFSSCTGRVRDNGLPLGFPCPLSWALVHPSQTGPLASA